MIDIIQPRYLLIQLFYFCDNWNLLFTLVSGFILPLLILKKPKQEKATLLYKFSLITLLISLLLGVLSPFLISIIEYISGYNVNYTFKVNYLFIVIVFSFSILISIAAMRYISPAFDNLKHKLTIKTELERNKRTDVRNIKDYLPETVDYNPEDYIDLRQGVFIGLNEKHQPRYIPIKEWQSQHADIIGTTGAGKGVASGLLLYQSILLGEGVFVCDPKDDEWAPHLFRYACEKANKPFCLIDLRKDEYQLDFLSDINSEQLEELLVAGFSLAEKGDIADFYRIDDRRAARITSGFIDKHKTIRSLFNSEYVQSISETIKCFFGKLEELALLNSINAKDGFALKSIFDNGGCCYIIGSMRNSKIISAQRMILVRLLQLAESRDRINEQPRPIAIFLDELKYHLSRPALEGLGAARDKGVHIIMAHQSIGDLRDCPADLNGDSVVSSIVENTKFKLVYKLQDPETAEWIAKMSGLILVDDETRKIEVSDVLTEEVSHDRSIRQAERFYVDTNMLLNLPPFVSFIFTAKDLTAASLISPVKVKKRPLVIYNATNNEPDILKETFIVSLSPDESMINNQDEPVFDIPDEPIINNQDEPVFDIPDEPIINNQDEPVFDIPDEPMINNQDEPVFDIPDEPMINNQDELLTIK